MISELRPHGLKEAAFRLGLDPFELVRLLVQGPGVPDGLLLSEQVVQTIKSTAGLRWLWNGITLPEDEHAGRARVRAALRILVDEGFVGESTTRVDNLWRGLNAADALLVRSAVAVLIQEGMLQTFASPLGMQVSAVSERVQELDKIAAGGTAPAALASIWKD